MIFDIYFILGCVGVLLLVLAYYFLSKKKLKTNYVLYHLLNLFGAAGIIISTFATQSWPAFALGLIILIISIFYI